MTFYITFTYQKHVSNSDALWKLHNPVCRFIRREYESQREVGAVTQNVNLKKTEKMDIFLAKQGNKSNSK